MRNKVAIIGYGFVGKAMHLIFPDAVIYDPYASGIESATQAEVNECGLAIVCVPTPMKETAEEFLAVDTSIVEECVKWLQTPLICIKSTVPPGTTDRLNNLPFHTRQIAGGKTKKICFSPEYIGEGKYQQTPWKYMSPTDPRLHEFLIVGGEQEAREAVCNYFVKRLGPEKTYYLMEAKEAEVVKYMVNSWGAMKVIFANEFYQLCQQLGVSYIKVREGWALDNRVERMHTAVFVDEQGFGGKCYPKDLNGIAAFGDSVGVDMSLIKAVLRKNKKLQ